MNKRNQKKKKILREECFEILKGFTIKEILILNQLKGRDLNDTYDLKLLLRKIKRFKDLVK